MMNKGMKFNRAIEDELSRRRSASERRLAEHKADIRNHYPEINALRQEIAELSLDFSDKMIASPKDADALSELASGVISEKKRELQKLLCEAGLPNDYLELVPECAACGDTGIIDGQLCACVKNVIIKSTFPDSGLNRGQTFELMRRDIIDDPRERRAYERISEYCLDYAEKFPDNDLGDILLFGVPGVGKTFLLNAIGERVLKRGYSVLRLTSNKLITVALNCINEHEPLPDLTAPDLFILDDLGTEPMINNVTIETILSIICERQDKGLATLIATNKSLDDLSDEYGDRIYSRLLTPQRVKVIKMTTPSIRFIKT